MLRENWNSDWIVSKSSDNPMMAAVMGIKSEIQKITLPHDAMIHEDRTKNTKNKHQTGFYPGGCYTYTKTFDVPKEWEEKLVSFEFEGVFENARVYINGDYAGGCKNGYREFIIEANDFIHYGSSNIVMVIANNSVEENSRWYTGSGIYRDVNLIVANPVHVKVNSLRIATPEVEKDLATVEVNMILANKSLYKKKTDVNITFKDDKSEIVAEVKMPVTTFSQTEECIRTRIPVVNPKLWSCETPNMYTCEIKVFSDEQLLDETIENFGIRTISMSSTKGFRLNNEIVKLRGACIHHDNGVIGAIALERAEERRIQQLKSAGFNSIRCSHQPASKAMLRACDREGILVLDDLADSWTRSKNNNDYANEFPLDWEKDVQAMVEKNYNHPSVIVYISGNEIQEAATAKGSQLNRLITKKFHELDSTRFVTVAINGLLSCMERMGEIMCDITGMTLEQMMEMQAQQAQAAQSDAGVDAANGATDLMKGPMADAFAANGIVTNLLNEFASVTDIVGYNYLTARHELEHELYPHRVILGTETLPSDMVRLWNIVKNNAHVIGDMTWTGYDYIGEAGSSCFYYDGRQGFMENWPISLSGMGDIDIIGNRRPISYFREILYGLRKEPYIAVERVNHFGEKPNHSAWPWKDELESWTWNGFEGKGAVVNVYSDADEVELFKNGISLGVKPVGEDNQFFASFETTYEFGELVAVNYRNGKKVEQCTLKSIDSKTKLNVDVDRTRLIADGADLAYLMISFKDENGIVNMQAENEVTVIVEGVGTLQGMGSADPETDNKYDNNTWKLYDGYVLAVVRSGFEAGEIKAVVSSGNSETVEICIDVIK